MLYQSLRGAKYTLYLGTGLLYLLFYLLCYAAVLTAHKIYLITIYIQICMNKSLLIADYLERLFY